MMNCRELTEHVASDRDRDAGRVQRLTTAFHLLMCRHCRRYVRQLRAIGSELRTALGPLEADTATLERLEAAIRTSADEKDVR